MPATERRILKSAAETGTRSLAEVITNEIRRSGSVDIHAIGAASVNQAVKGLIVATSKLAESGVDIVFQPNFRNFIDEDGRECTRMELSVTKRASE